MAQGKQPSDSTSADKPVNPLEREERVGIQDGSDHTGERVTTSRHGTADAPPRAEPGSSTQTDRPRNPSAPGKA